MSKSFSSPCTQYQSKGNFITSRQMTIAATVFRQGQAEQARHEIEMTLGPSEQLPAILGGVASR
ncbi:MAG: hypothetical protein AAGC91_01105 [Pseudomonadota bacterium]